MHRIPIDLTSVSNKLSVQLLSKFLTDSAILGKMTQNQKLSHINFSLDRVYFSQQKEECMGRVKSGT